MLEISGKYNTAKVYTDRLDSASEGQIKALMNAEFIESSTVRMMPDVHAGAGCVIGTTMTIKDKVVPNLVGVDIGCGVHVVKLKEKRIELPKLDSVIHKNIPVGFAIREKTHKFARDSRLHELKCYIDYMKGQRSISTLGGGNHFVSIEVDDFGNNYLLIHTGSRNVGKRVAEYYQEKAYNYCKWKAESGVTELVAKLKAEGRTDEIEGTVKRFKSEVKPVYELSYLEGDLLEDYLHDMRVVQEMADLNRKAIAEVILSEMSWHEEESFTTVHNYIDLDNMILRKGAVSAQLGEKLIIPMNMRDGSLICIGKGNPDWNYSAPHGAGRLMSRTEAENSISMSEYKSSMEGIYSSTVSKGTLDEAPQAYKPMEDIIRHIEPTVEIVTQIKPIYNFKGNEEKKSWKEIKAAERSRKQKGRSSSDR